MKQAKKSFYCLQWPALPVDLKVEALNKAIRIGYNETEAKKLFFNVNLQKTALIDGVIDKGFKF